MTLTILLIVTTWYARCRPSFYWRLVALFPISYTSGAVSISEHHRCMSSVLRHLRSFYSRISCAAGGNRGSRLCCRLQHTTGRSWEAYLRVWQSTEHSSILFVRTLVRSGLASHSFGSPSTSRSGRTVLGLLESYTRSTETTSG